MPTLDNARHERFAQFVASGMAASAAYVKAGYSEKSATVEPYRLLEKPSVIERIAQLQEQAARKTGLTAERIINDLLRIAEKGEELQEASGLAVARGALMDAAKVAGLIVEKRQNENTTTVKHVRNLPKSAEEWKQRFGPDGEH